MHTTVRFDFSDQDAPWTLTIRRGVLEVTEGVPLPDTPAPVATLHTDTVTWKRLVLSDLTPLAALANGALFTLAYFLGLLGDISDVATNFGILQGMEWAARGSAALETMAGLGPVVLDVERADWWCPPMEEWRGSQVRFWRRG